ncbi:MAG: hypothetical protein CMM60_11340 [Rhodospirillaceae bacterium]|jgi:hypothetical protein|nr:hypothetical protein [Rhodospirillaceae bacterium]|tara:strand:- start:4003 stop:5298 length:1296 start_codon:yes stop_codon:yes gene_type:complete
MAISPENQPPSQENLLLDYMRRLEKHKEGRKAVHLHLSLLRPMNRRQQHIRTAAGNFETIVKSMDGQVFTVKNADILVIYKETAHPQVETAVQQIRCLFDDDPLIVEEGNSDQKFASWYDAEQDFDAVLQIVQGMAHAEQKRQTEVRGRMDARAALKTKQEQGEPLTPRVLARVETALSKTDLSNLVRRQFICRVDSNMVPERIFSELFISIKDLRETMLPDVNLAANRWLFQHLTTTLDQRMLSMLTKTDGISMSGDISFNINVATLLSPGFQSFDDNIAARRRGTMIIELQKEDIFRDLASYLFAREFVQEKGYKVCLDGLTARTIDIIDRERLGADIAKLIWHTDLVDGGDELHEKIREIIKRGGPDRLILCRCDNREAIDFGHSVGIDLFQGRYVESLIAEDGRRRELLKLKRRIERSEADAFLDEE